MPHVPAAVQALAEYASLQFREVLGRVEGSVASLDSHELASVGAGVVLIAVLLLRRGGTNVR